MPTTTVPATEKVLDERRGSGLIAESLDSALGGRQERFHRRFTDGTLDMAAVLHDARTPLTVISASAGLALRGEPGDQRAHLLRVLDSARLLEEILVRGLEFLRTSPEGGPRPDLGALLLAAAALPSGAELTLRSETVLGADGAPFAVRATVEGTPAEGVPAATRRALLRHGASVWDEASQDGATRFVAEIPFPRAD